MFKGLRGPEKLFRLGQWLIALLFAYFLTQVGGKLIADLPTTTREPYRQQFVEKGIGEIKSKISVLEQNAQKIRNEIRATERLLSQIREDYDSAVASFEHWKSTRQSTGEPKQNSEVVRRAHALDLQLEDQSKTQDLLHEQENLLEKINGDMEPLQKKRQELEKKENDAYQQALSWHRLKIFFYRLALVGPILILGIFLFRRYRNSTQWPFVWGFLFFALFAFFFELVPYLPSFGGYIRYGVGALLTYFVGRHLISALQRYLEEKREEQERPQEDRKQTIAYEHAIGALSKNQCPSCERTFVGNDSEVNFCMHCGLKVYEVCSPCGHRHNAFFNFCPSCGVEKITSTTN